MSASAATLSTSRREASSAIPLSRQDAAHACTFAAVRRYVGSSNVVNDLKSTPSSICANQAPAGASSRAPSSSPSNVTAGGTGTPSKNSCGITSIIIMTGNLQATYDSFSQAPQRFLTERALCAVSAPGLADEGFKRTGAQPPA